jgi:hypothetical protein
VRLGDAATSRQAGVLSDDLGGIVRVQDQGMLALAAGTAVGARLAAQVAAST